MKKIILVGLVVIAITIGIIEFYGQNIKKNFGISLDTPALTGTTISATSFSTTLNLLVNNPTSITCNITGIAGTIVDKNNNQIGTFSQTTIIPIVGGPNKVPVNISASGINSALLLLGTNNITVTGTIKLKKGFLIIDYPFSQQFTLTEIVGVPGPVKNDLPSN